MSDVYESTRRRRVWSYVFVGLGIVALARPATAQEAQDAQEAETRASQTEAVALEPVTVSAERLTPVAGAATAVVSAEEVRDRQAKDVAEILKARVPGVTGKRIGGMHLDPMIRGLREDRLSVLTNGTKIWGGGPFRMDPPTSLLEVEELEAIEVIKGPYSVTRGPSSIGGTINLVTKQPELSPAWYANGSLGSLYASNYNGFATLASVAAGGPNLAFRVSASYRDYQDYESGDGERIQAGFQSQSVSGSLLWQPHTHHRLRLSVSRESDRDARFATLPLHLEEDDAYLGSVTYTIRKPLPFVHSLEFTGYYNYVHHRMNNEHKPHRAGSGAGGGRQDGSGPGNMDRRGHPPGHDDHMMTGNGHDDHMMASGHGEHMTSNGHDAHMMDASHDAGHAGHAHPVRRIVLPLDARTFGGRVQANLLPSFGGRLAIGGDVYRLEREGTNHVSFLSGAMAGMTRYFHVWPDTHIMDGGIFGEYDYRFAPQWRLVVGTRVDFVDAGAKPDVDTRLAYQRFYAAGADDVEAFETNVSANGRLIYSPVSWLDLFVGLGRAVRTADATERYFALGPGPGGFYVGNPGLDPEESLEVDVGLRARWGRLAVDGTFFYNRIDDYILQYILDSQFPCPHGPCNLRGFRNIAHAALIGADLGLSYAVREDVTVSGAFAYVYAENEADNTALPEIPPLEGRLGVRYEHADWGVWLHPTVRLVQSQHRIDSAFGENTTPGFVTADLSAGWRFLGRHELTINVVNLFDKNYHEHMTRENPFSEREVFEPGRVVTVGLRIRF
ncbi:MAG: TonB-dependent receptor [Desulfurellaceae bacterium]|nr:TonB-dependent receptor [Desulfurellaceae bacterium]